MCGTIGRALAERCINQKVVTGMDEVGVNSGGNQTPHHSRRVLLIEDDLELAEEIRGELGDHGYEVRHAASGLDGAAQAESGTSNLLIVDRMLPELDGLAIIEQVCERDRQTPVLVLSALGDVNERVRGLKAAVTTTSPSRSRCPSS